MQNLPGTCRGGYNEDRVVRGTILIEIFNIHVLFDIDCIPSTRIAKKLVLKTSTLPHPLRITTTRARPEFTTQRVQSLEFEI